MIIYVDGPEKAGKTTLVSNILEGFEPERSKLIKNTGPDKVDGYGYLRPFVASLDSDKVYVWDRGWVSEAVYGKLLHEERSMSEDMFMNEWFYGRMMQGRGGKFILLPWRSEMLAMLRDETDLDVDPIEEYGEFEGYASEFRYSVLKNDYELSSLSYNARVARLSAFIPTHNVPSTDYIGPLKPDYTFIGDTRQDWAWDVRPFSDMISAQYFRPFGGMALHHFGYMTTDSASRLIKEKSPLVSRPIAVGPRAKYMFPNFPSVVANPNRVTKDSLMVFENQLMNIIAGGK